MSTRFFSTLVALAAFIFHEYSLFGNSSSDEVAVAPPMQGLLLVSNEQAFDDPLREAVGLEISGLDLPGNFDLLKGKLEPYFANKSITADLLLDLKNEILTYYQEHHRPVVLVEIPKQEISSGTVRFVIRESQLGEVICKGNRYFTDHLVKSYIHLKPGEKIASHVLLSDVAFLNRNPFRHTDAILSAGKEPDTTDIILLTKDRLPLRFYVGGDNTGTVFTGNARWFTGINWGNVFGWDHSFSYQYTTSSDFHKFQAHTFHYTAPFRNHHTLVAYGGLSYTKPDLSSLNQDVMPSGGTLHSSGFNSQASLRYGIPIGSLWNSNLLQMLFGFDYKYLNNNLEYIGDNRIPVVFKKVAYTQLVGEIQYGRASERHQLMFEANVYGAPGQFVANAGNSHFNNLRNRAKNQYIYGKVAFSDLYHMPHHCDLYFIFRGQAASDPLLPSEQYGLGGYDTVRGYNEREYNADNAVLGTLEFRMPAFQLFLRSSNQRKQTDSLYFLVFTDFAQGWNYRSLSNENSNDWLASIGPGLRYSIGRYLVTRVDWGFKLHKDDAIGHHYSKWHFSLIGSY